MKKVNIYIDGNNLYRSAKELGFEIDYKKVTKQNDNRKTVYVYDVKVNPEPYFEMMHEFIRQLGLNDSIVPNPSDYKGLPSLELKVSIKPNSRQLTKIQYLSTGQEETYSGYGQNGPVVIPKDTITMLELQQRLQQLQ